MIFYLHTYYMLLSLQIYNDLDVDVNVDQTTGLFSVYFFDFDHCQTFELH